MNDTPVRVRFAPSPTGRLHIGSVRTALYNWAFARANGGTFILRIDDTDPARSTQENIDIILRALDWLELDWDEGPGVGGPYAPYYQTERLSLYVDALETLKRNERVYPCFCSAESLAAKRESNRAAGIAGYDRACRDIDPEVARTRIAAGEPHVWRLKVPLAHGPITFTDAINGFCSFPDDVMDDFVLMRSDGTPTYNFSTVVDDAQMQISHVIRGNDHLSNTPRQILVYEALDAPLPVFAHLPMINGSDGKKLSKRHGATSVEEFRDLGFFPDVLINYLALLGWSLDGETTLFDRKTLCERFSLDRISKSPAAFDETKLAWMNQQHIKTMGAAAFIDALTPYLEEAGLATADEISSRRTWFEDIYPLVAERAKTMHDVCPMIAFLFSGSHVTLDETSSVKTFGKIEAACAVIDAALAVLSDPALPFTTEGLHDALNTIPEQMGLKPRAVFQVIRVALTGNMVSPPLFESMVLIGNDDCQARLEAARAYCTL
jgi:glutamyl-tRNA synthetase